MTCPLDAATPQLFAVSQPYVNGSGAFTINGLGFGATKGTGQVTLDGTIVLPTTGWSDTHDRRDRPGRHTRRAHQLKITAEQRAEHRQRPDLPRAGQRATTRTCTEVGPGKTYATIQAALDAAYASTGDDLVVVYPGQPDLANPRNNPRGAYYENLIMASPVKLQGVGPGGFQGNTFVPGSIIDASAFGGDTDAGHRLVHQGRRADLGRQPGRQRRRGDLRARLAERHHRRRTRAPVHQRLQGRHRRLRHPRRRPAGLPGQHQRPDRRPDGLPPSIETQGGAIFANAYARNLQITNNVVQNNGGGYGTIRIGTPDLAGAGHQPAQRERPDRRQPDHRQRRHQPGRRRSGSSPASDGYEVAAQRHLRQLLARVRRRRQRLRPQPERQDPPQPDLLQQVQRRGRRHHDRRPAAGRPRRRSRPASGPVDIYANQIQANLANDDGGGIRFLMAGQLHAMNVYNNMIVNNVSTHEGGGIASTTPRTCGSSTTRS